jgi:hypothetical protein
VEVNAVFELKGVTGAHRSFPERQSDEGVRAAARPGNIAGPGFLLRCFFRMDDTPRCCIEIM